MAGANECTPMRYRPGVRRDGVPAVRYQVIHGYRRAFIDEGRGPALLLIHGIGDSSDTWRTVLDQLVLDHRVIVPDLLGHGRSEKPRADYSVAAYANGMRDLLTVLGVDRVTVIGHSLGGGVAAQFTYQYPERVERLVLVASGGIGRSVSPLLRAAAVPGAELVMPFLGLPPVRAGARAAGRLVAAMNRGIGRDVEEIIAVVDALPNTTSRRAILRTLRSGVDWRGQAITMLDRAYLAEGVPTLIIWGEEDAIIPVGHARLAHAAIPGSTLDIFEEAGHFPHHTHPERFLTAVTEFLAKPPGPRFDAEHWRQRLDRGRRYEGDVAEATEAEIHAANHTPAT